MNNTRASFALSFTLVLAAVIVVACSDRSPPMATAPSATISANQEGANGNHGIGNADDGQPHASDGPAVRVFELRNSPRYARSGGFSGGGTGIYYHGGPVLASGTNVAAVYWASAPIYTGGPSAGTHGAGSVDGSLVGFFLSHLGGSPYFNINTTYTNGTTTHIANVVNYTSYWANNTNAPANGQNVSDLQMLSMLQSGFASGALTYDPSTLYAIFTAGKVNLGGGFGTQYCAYHWYGTVTVGGVQKTVLYAAMPYDYAYPGACTNGTAAPNADPGADAEVNTLAHEVEETTTDMFGTAWYDRRGYENADKCAWLWGSTYTTSLGGIANIKVGGKDFLVQENWVNSGSGGCLQHWP